MNSDEEFLTISIGLTEEDYERRHKENSWYSVRFIYLLTKWRYTTWRSIRKSPKCYITFQVLLLIVSLTLISLTTYLLRKHFDQLGWHKTIFICLYILIVAICSIDYFRLFFRNRKQNYLLNDTQTLDRSDPRFFVFIFIYIIFGMLPVSYLEQCVSVDFENISFLLLFIYGIFAELYVILFYGYFLMFTIFIYEFFIRLLKYRLTWPCPRNSGCIVKKFCILKYNTQIFNEDICKICRIDFENNDRICALNCSGDHIFHEHCLKESINRGAYDCPSCGMNIIAI